MKEKKIRMVVDKKSLLLADENQHNKRYYELTQ